MCGHSYIMYRRYVYMSVCNKCVHIYMCITSVDMCKTHLHIYLYIYVCAPLHILPIIHVYTCIMYKHIPVYTFIKYNYIFIYIYIKPV